MGHEARRAPSVVGPFPLTFDTPLLALSPRSAHHVLSTWHAPGPVLGVEVAAVNEDQSRLRFHGRGAEGVIVENEVMSGSIACSKGTMRRVE